MDVLIERSPDDDRLEELGVDTWTTWTKEVSEFDWSYGDTETCYILEGRFSVTLPDGRQIEAAEGDVVQFPAGLDCRWSVEEDLRKVYTMGDDVELKPTKSESIS